MRFQSALTPFSGLEPCAWRPCETISTKSSPFSARSIFFMLPPMSGTMAKSAAIFRSRSRYSSPSAEPTLFVRDAGDEDGPAELKARLQAGAGERDGGGRAFVVARPAAVNPVAADRGGEGRDRPAVAGRDDIEVSGQQQYLPARLFSAPAGREERGRRCR